MEQIRKCAVVMLLWPPAERLNLNRPHANGLGLLTCERPMLSVDLPGSQAIRLAFHDHGESLEMENDEQNPHDQLPAKQAAARSFNVRKSAATSSASAASS